MNESEHTSTTGCVYVFYTTVLWYSRNAARALASTVENHYYC